MMLAIDHMAQRYGKLPSEIIHNATMVDFAIMDATLTVQSYETAKKNNDFDKIFDVEALKEIHAKSQQKRRQ